MLTLHKTVVQCSCSYIAFQPGGNTNLASGGNMLVLVPAQINGRVASGRASGEEMYVKSNMRLHLLWQIWK